MKKVLSLIILCAFSIHAYPQEIKERRVYYLDCSYSMKTNGIWDDVRENLKKAIDNINDERTELIVIPFADNPSPNPTLKPMVGYATSAGKEKLKSQIDALPMNKNTMTYHYIPLNDFYNHRVNEKLVTYMFLMTDGQDEDSQQRTLKQLLPQWGSKYGNSQVYGFYVMLHNQAMNSAIDKVVKKQDHLWIVEKANVNVNLIRLETSAIYNAKNEDNFNIKILSGDVSGKTFDCNFPANCPYSVRKTEVILNQLKVWVQKPSGQKLPENANYILSIKMNNREEFDFLVTEKIPVQCEYKPERSLKITVR